MNEWWDRQSMGANVISEIKYHWSEQMSDPKK
jgi:hypothetical protein